MQSRFFVAAIVSVLGATAVHGQSAVRLALAPGSLLTFEGTSTLHSFSCKTDKLEAYIDVDPSYKTKDLRSMTRPIMKVQVRIPVKSLTCGDKKLENNMYKTLKADDNPTISYVMTDYSFVDGSQSASGFTAKTSGKLTVAGSERPIELSVVSQRADDGTVTAKAEQAILMTDYGIKPPTFMLGALRVGNKVTIQFTVKATQASVAAAIAEATRSDVAYADQK